MNQKSKSVVFLWRTASIHTIAYFIAGIFALVVMNYREHFDSEIMAVIMRPVDSPWVALGAGLQIVRGFIIGLVLLPFKSVILSRMGWLKLSGLVLGLSYLSTIGPTFGSFEGYIYTKIPWQYHVLGIPETLLYVFLFAFLMSLWYKKPARVWNVLAIVLVVLIAMMSVLGYLAGVGVIQR